MLTTYFPQMQVVFEVTKRKRVTVDITPEGLERRSRLGAAKCCLACERKFKTHPKTGEIAEETRCGQCMTCYPASRLKIRHGDITIEELVAIGKMLEPQNGGRPPKNKYTSSLSKR